MSLHLVLALAYIAIAGVVTGAGMERKENANETLCVAFLWPLLLALLPFIAIGVAIVRYAERKEKTE